LKFCSGQGPYFLTGDLLQYDIDDESCNNQPSSKRMKPTDQCPSDNSCHLSAEHALTESVKARLNVLKNRKKPWTVPLQWDYEAEIQMRKQDWIKNKIREVKKKFGTWLQPIYKDKLSFQCKRCFEHKKALFLQANPIIETEITNDAFDNFQKSTTSTFSKTTGYDPENEQHVDKYRNLYKRAHDHENSATHIRAINNLKRAYALDQEEETKILLATSAITATDRMILLTYQQVKINSPLSNHRSWVDLLKQLGVDLGVHHYERSSAVRIEALISEILHKKLIDFIKQSDIPMSIIVDTTTDSQQNNYLIVYIRLVHHNYPFTYFYTLINLNAEDAQSMFDSIVNKFIADEVDNIMKQRLVAFASDGASVMTGYINGLAAKFRRFITHERDLYAVHCMSHKLNLVVVKGLRAVPEVQFLESQLSNLFNFFTNKGGKRLSAFMQLCDSLGRRMYTIKGLFEIRWAPSEFASIKNFILNYPMLIEFFENVASDESSFDEETRIRALNYLENMAHVGFHALVTFTADLLEVISRLAKEYQLLAGTLVGQHSRLERFVQELNYLQTNDGPYLRSFLSQV
jgi:hypothetical protein